MSLILSGSEGLSDVDGTAATPAIRGTDTNTGIFFPAADTIAFSEGGAEVARFDSVGNFGVGTPNPGTRVDAYVSGTGSSILRARNDGTVVYLDANNGYSYLNTFSNHPMLFGTNNTERARITSGGSFQIGSSTGSDPRLFVYDNDTTDAAIIARQDGSAPIQIWQGSAGSERMRITSSGSVGIGTTSPTANLEVIGAISSVNGYQDNIVLQNALSGSRNRFLLGQSLTNGAYIYTDAPGGVASPLPMTFWTAGSERMRIDSSGNLLVGTTSAVARTVSEANGASLAMLSLRNSDTGSASQGISLFYRNGSLTGSISNTNTTTAYNTSSDYRLKHDIAPMTGALAKVVALNPVTYKWNADNSNGEGFIAHELAEVVPQCVTGEKDAVDADGNPQYQGIDTSFLVATLTAAIQELKAELDAVKTELAALKGTA